jgi:hypothetical protein
MTSPAAWYQARTAKTSTTQPPALVMLAWLAPAPMDSRTSPTNISQMMTVRTRSVRSEAILGRLLSYRIRCRHGALSSVTLGGADRAVCPAGRSWMSVVTARTA